MKKQYRSDFETRQKMRKPDYEILYYSDSHFQSVAVHRHDYYEFYFPVDGVIEMEISRKRTPLSSYDVVLVPPDTDHRAVTENSEHSYCRYVFWISVAYYKQLVKAAPFMDYIVKAAEEKKRYIHHFTETENSVIRSKILRLIEEDHSIRYGRDDFAGLCIMDLIMTLSRFVYEHDHPAALHQPEDQVQAMIEYIENNIDGDLSLESLGERFFLSKYHVAHIFRERTGMTVHRYITRKRLERTADDIKAGKAVSLVYQDHGFNDYSSFFRAFKKEYGISPKEYQAVYLHDPAYPGMYNSKKEVTGK